MTNKIRLEGICTRREKISRGIYKIIVIFPTYNKIYYVEKGIKGWWLQSDKKSPITKVNTLLDAEFKAAEISKVNS